MATTDLHLRGGRVLDPASGTDADLDVIITAGRVRSIGRGLSTPSGHRVVSVAGRWVLPGLIDLHTHLREPGEEGKETVETGCRAAAAGGFTAVCAMPNTRPVNDSALVTRLILDRARALGSARVYAVGAITQGLLGEALTNLAELKAAGVVAISDDGKCVMNAHLMRRAMEYARTFGLVVTQHAEDHNLSGKGVMNEGALSARLGLPGQPIQAETVIVARDLQLLELVGGRYHVAHVSAKETVAMVREAKRKGLQVTCEATPHHFTLTEAACDGYRTEAKVNPPLRTDADREAVIEGLADGTVDAIATDHAPHRHQDKEVEFDQAAFGMVGLETCVPLTLGLVRAGRLSPLQAVERLTSGPARVYGLPGGKLAEGEVADVTVVDPDVRYKVDARVMISKSRNTPFDGMEVFGRAVLTLVEGRAIHGNELVEGGRA